MQSNERSPAGHSENNPSRDRNSLSGTQRKVNVGFAVAIACLGLVGLTSYFSVERERGSLRSVAHTHDVLDSLENLLSIVTDAETAERGYVISGDVGYLEPYRHSLQTIDGVERRLTELTVDNSIQQQRLRSLRTLVGERLEQFNLVLELRRTQGFEAAQREILKGLGRRMHEQIRGVIDAMTATEQHLLEGRQQQARRSTVINQSVTWGGGLLALVFLILAAFAIRRDLIGRERAERALRQARDELEVRVHQRTAELARANDSLTESERRYRAFVDATSDTVYRVSGDWSQMRHLHGQDFTPDTAEPAPSWIEKHIHPDDRTRLGEALRTAIQTKNTFELEHRVFRDDGTLGWIFSRAVPLFNEGGEIAEWFGTATDVTARKLAETKFQTQLARLSLLSQITRAIGSARISGAFSKS